VRQHHHGRTIPASCGVLRGIVAQVDDEGAVDLQGRGRQSLEVVQGRVGGPEVVDRHVNAQPAQGDELGHVLLDVAHDGRLGQLELEPAPVEAGARSSASCDLRHHVALLELLGGEVERDHRRRSPRRSSCGPDGRPASSSRCPTAPISPASSATGMNAPGGTQPRSGWGQRARASTEVMRPSVSDTRGW
jgi:hypothetical protein